MFLILFTFGNANDDKPGAKAIVSNTNIVAGDIVTLRIKATGDSVVFPKFEEIDGVKVLSHHERITNIHTYNLGKFRKERTTLTLTFAPQRDMTIPSYDIQIDGRAYQTEPIEIRVGNTDDSNMSSNRIFSLKLAANRRSVALGESFLATVYFSFRQDAVISGKPQYIRPEFKGFFVRKIDKEKRYLEGGQQITELSYILTPHSEGNFTLGPAVAKIGIEEKSKKDKLNKGFATKWYEKASNTLELEVSPLTVQSDLVGTFRLDANISALEAEANRPISLTVKMEGRGNLADFDFPDYELEGVTVYSDDATIEIKVTDGQIYSSYSKKFVFVSPRSFTVPERIFSSYDQIEKKSNKLEIKAFAVQIKNAKSVTPAAKISKPAPGKKNISKKTIEEFFAKWWEVLLSFVLGGIVFYLLRSLPGRKSKSSKESEALTILYAHTGKDSEVEAMVRKLYARKNGDKSVEINKKRLKEMVEYFRGSSG